MEIDWSKWQAIELRHNQLKASVDFCRGRLEIATVNARNAELALHHTAGSQGLFRKSDRAVFMQHAKSDPQGCLAQHADHPIQTILKQFAQTRLERQRAADAHAQAESAYFEPGKSYHPLRQWIAEQQARGLI